MGDLLSREELEKERDVALADNAALWRIVSVAAPTFAVLSRAPEVAPEIRAELATAEALLLAGGKHPGAALLEEHRKALVRARNEGLEVAGKKILSTAVMPEYLKEYWPSRDSMLAVNDGWAAGVNHALDTIRAMRKPVPCCERDTNGDGDCDQHPRIPVHPGGLDEH